MNNCPHCDHAVADSNDDFCLNCGGELNVHSSASEPKVELAPAPEPPTDGDAPESVVGENLELGAGTATCRDTANDTAAWLPRRLMEMGWWLDDETRVENDVCIEWQARTAEQERSAVFRVHLGPILSPPEVLAALQDEVAPTVALIPLLAWGTQPFQGLCGRDQFYELVARPRDARSLAEWLLENPEQKGDASAIELVRNLLELWSRLREKRIDPCLLDPDFLSIRANGQILLSTAGSLTLAEAGMRVVTCRSAPLIRKVFSAPELIESGRVGATSASFSIAQIASVVALGRAMHYEDLREGRVPFQRVESASLANILMGGLWQKPHQRWGLRDLLAAVRGDDLADSQHPWRSLHPKAANEGFLLGGVTYWRPDELLMATALPQNHDEACRRIDDILNWLQGGYLSGIAKTVGEVSVGRSCDWKLLHLRFRALPDLPHTWATLSISERNLDSTLTSLGQRILQGDKSAATTLERLLDADLRGVFSL